VSELLAEETVVESIQPTSVRLTFGAIVVAAITNLIWGTNPAALKIALNGLPTTGQGFPPIGASGMRFGIAVIGVLIWCFITGARIRPRPGEGRWLVVNSGLFLIQIATFTLGVYFGTAAHSIVVLYVYPFIVVALAHFLIPGERVSPGRVAGLGTAFSGVVLLFGSGFGHWEGTLLLGDLIQLLSAAILASQIVFLKHALARIEPTRVVLWQMLAAAAAFLAYSFGAEHLAATHATAASWAAVIYQGVVIGAICFTVWMWQIRRYSASVLSIFGFVAPPAGVAMSGLVLHEPLTPVVLAAAALVAAGIVASNLW
jgi:drug/metabolite transporter (DMT)-like permease